MNLREIENLLEKYYSGETTLEEEKYLREYFNRGDIPEKLLLHKEQFCYYSFAQTEKSSHNTTEKEISEILSKASDNRKTTNKRRMYYTLSAIAAAVIILFGVYFHFIVNEKKSKYEVENTYEDPEKAYAEAKKALLLVSEKFNAGVQDFNKFSTFSQYQELITRKN